MALTLPAFNECQDVSEDLRDILGKAARRTADTSQRLLVFRALWSAAAVCQSPELFFGNALIWATILQGLKQEEDTDIRESALGVLGALTGQQAVAHFLWREKDEDEDERSDVCEDIFLNTLREQPPRVRGKALTVVAGSRFYQILLVAPSRAQLTNFLYTNMYIDIFIDTIQYIHYTHCIDYVHIELFCVLSMHIYIYTCCTLCIYIHTLSFSVLIVRCVLLCTTLLHIDPETLANRFACRCV